MARLLRSDQMCSMAPAQGSAAPRLAVVVGTALFISCACSSQDKAADAGPAADLNGVPDRAIPGDLLDLTQTQDALIDKPDLRDLTDEEAQAVSELRDESESVAELPDLNAAEAPGCDFDSCEDTGPAVWEPCGPPGGNGLDEVPMCDVPGGPFQMGLAPGDCPFLSDFISAGACATHTSSETPFHTVTLSPYRVDQVEITVSRYRMCETAGACTQPAMLPPDDVDKDPQGAGRGTGNITGTISSVLSNDELVEAHKYVIVASSLPPDPGDAIFNLITKNLPAVYTVTGVPEGEYMVLPYMDLLPYKIGAGPGLEDYVGMYKDNKLELVVVVADATTKGIDIVADTPFGEAPWGKGCTWAQPDNEDLPLNCATWHQLKEYCQWAGKRLCTEAEFEKAAKGEEHRIWPWGNEWADGMGNAYEVASDGHFWVAPVGSFPEGASPYGCLDMDANVMEWVLDWYDKQWYVKTSSQDPKGPCDGGEPCLGMTERVLKGTSWRAQVGTGYGIEFDTRNSSRIPYPPVDPQLDDVGARCCESL